MNLAPLLRAKFTDSNNNPLSGGKLYSYQSGTTTPQVTYTDSSGGTPNANPVILDANGEADIWLDPTLSYKFVLRDSTDVDQFMTDNVVGALAPDTVLTVSLQDSAVTTAKIADNAVTSAKLSSSASIDLSRAVTTDHIRDSAVTTAKIAAGGVTTTNILDGNVTSAKIAPGGVTQDRLASRATGSTVAAGGFATSSSSGAYSTSSTSFTAVTNLSVTITTTGRPVFVGLISDGSGNFSEIYESGGSLPNTSMRFLRSGTEISRQHLIYTSSANQVYLPPSSISHYDAPAAGTYTYTFEVHANNPNTCNINYVNLVAFEI